MAGYTSFMLMCGLKNQWSKSSVLSGNDCDLVSFPVSPALLMSNFVPIWECRASRWQLAHFA